MKYMLGFLLALLSTIALAQLTQPPGGITANLPPWSGGNGSSGQVLTSRGATLAPTFQASSGGATGANPTASVGTAAVNGVATTFLRSDGAPALSQAIVPTWTGQHTFTTTATLSTFGGTAGGQRYDGAFAAISASPSFSLNNTGAGANAKDFSIDGSATAHFKIIGFDDTKGSSFTYLDILRSATGINPVSATVGTGLISGGTKFTAVGTGCTVGATTGGAAAGTFTLAAGPCTSVAITMAGATGSTAPTGWACMGSDRTAPTVLISESASTATTATLTIPAGAGTADVISFFCTGY